jgi:hypothetical protein
MVLDIDIQIKNMQIDYVDLNIKNNSNTQRQK